MNEQALTEWLEWLMVRVAMACFAFPLLVVFAVFTAGFLHSPIPILKPMFLVYGGIAVFLGYLVPRYAGRWPTAVLVSTLYVSFVAAEIIVTLMMGMQVWN